MCSGGGVTVAVVVLLWSVTRDPLCTRPRVRLPAAAGMMKFSSDNKIVIILLRSTFITRSHALGGGQWCRSYARGQSRTNRWILYNNIIDIPY